MKSILLLLFLFSIPLLAQNGVVKSYYPNRIVKSELTYINDVLDGPAVYYYPGGKLMLEKNFSKGILHGWIREYYEDGKLKSEFYVNHGIKDGDQKEYFPDGNLKAIVTYTDGKLINKQIFARITQTSELEKEDLAASNPIKKEMPVVDNQNALAEIKTRGQSNDLISPPSMIGGITSVQQKLIYPEDAIKFGLEGIVTIKVTIDEFGNSVSTQIVKGLGLGCDEAAISAIKQSKFVPAAKNGKPIEAQLLVDVSFSLPKRKDEIVKETIKKEKVESSIPEKRFEQNLSVMCEADRCPRPEDDMKTIYSRMQIPNVAKALKLKGMVLIEGIVDREGKLKQTKIIEGVGYGVDQQVESALLNSKFLPGIIKGFPAETKALFNFPFSFDW